MDSTENEEINMDQDKPNLEDEYGYEDEEEEEEQEGQSQNEDSNPAEKEVNSSQESEEEEEEEEEEEDEENAGAQQEFGNDQLNNEYDFGTENELNEKQQQKILKKSAGVQIAYPTTNRGEIGQHLGEMDEEDDNEEDQFNLKEESNQNRGTHQKNSVLKRQIEESESGHDNLVENGVMQKGHFALKKRANRDVGEEERVSDMQINQEDGQIGNSCGEDAEMEEDLEEDEIEEEDDQDEDGDGDDEDDDEEDDDEDQQDQEQGEDGQSGLNIQKKKKKKNIDSSDDEKTSTGQEHSPNHANHGNSKQSSQEKKKNEFWKYRHKNKDDKWKAPMPELRNYGSLNEEQMMKYIIERAAKFNEEILSQQSKVSEILKFHEKNKNNQRQIPIESVSGSLFPQNVPVIVVTDEGYKYLTNQNQFIQKSTLEEFIQKNVQQESTDCLGDLSKFGIKKVPLQKKKSIKKKPSKKNTFGADLIQQGD